MRWLGDLEKSQALLHEAAQLALGLSRSLADSEARLAAARIRLSGPILSQTLRLKAEIAATIATRDSVFSDAADVEEARVRLRELSAQQAQLELRTTIAAARARGSVRNSMQQQTIILAGLVAEQRLVVRLIGKNSLEWHQLALQINQTKARLLDMVLELEAINRALGTDLTNPLEQAENAFIEASRKLQLPDLKGLEKARAELDKENAANALERARFSTALFDLKFLSETGQLGTGAYLSALQALLAQVDTTTHQGKEIFLEIQALIDGLTDDIGDMAFNIPGSIRLPTLFEIRRAVQADALGVNYLDNRQIDIRVNVETVADMGEILQVLTQALNQQIPVEGQRLATGNAGLTVGPF
jgi:hypothetical protein